MRYDDILNLETLKTSLFITASNLTDIKHHNVPTGPGGPAVFPAIPQDPIRVIGGFTIGF